MSPFHKAFRQLPPPRWIAVDVDHTLVLDDGLNLALVDFLKQKKSKGFDLFLWSARGAKYAKQVAKTHDLESLFSAIISKPGFIIDDKGWGWIKDTKILGACEWSEKKGV